MTIQGHAYPTRRGAAGDREGAGHRFRSVLGLMRGVTLPFGRRAHSYGLLSGGRCRYGLYCYGLCSYCLHSYGLYSYGMYSYCLHIGWPT